MDKHNRACMNYKRVLQCSTLKNLLKFSSLLLKERPISRCVSKDLSRYNEKHRWTLPLAISAGRASSLQAMSLTLQQWYFSANLIPFRGQKVVSSLCHWIPAMAWVEKVKACNIYVMAVWYSLHNVRIYASETKAIELSRSGLRFNALQL